MMRRGAWTAWLQHGSREDWTDTVGLLRTPALIIAGEKDAALGPEAQRTLAARHFERARLVTLAGAGHLLPMERPHEIARLIAELAGGERPAADFPAALPVPYRRLLDSARISARTREILHERAQPDDPAYAPSALAASHLALLRALVDRVLPQTGPSRIDLAARIDAMLASGIGDGWRYDRLPPDRQAYQDGLATLDQRARAKHDADFAVLDAAAQDAMLREIAAGAAGDAGVLDAQQMRLWFEDVRADAVKLYVAHPATLARIGYSGTFYGGDGARKQGFVRIGAGEREDWEPDAAA